MRSSLLWGALGGAAYVYLATRPSRVQVVKSLQADPEALIRLVGEVEREPEFIPWVQSVKVEDRREGSVRYRVTVNVSGMPGWARFQKQILPESGRAEWQTLEG